MADADYAVRVWTGEILMDLTDGDVLPTDPPRHVPAAKALKEALAGAFGKLAEDRNPRIRAFAELGTSQLRDNDVERLRVRHEVEHFLEHCPRKEAAFEDLTLEKGRELRAGIKASVEQEETFLVITIACEPGKSEETPQQLTFFYRQREGEWVETLKDPRKKK
jgi:hypothetical protein